MNIILEIERFINENIRNIDILQHHYKTRYYLLILDKNASLEMQIAALTHDIERSFNKGSKSVKYNPQDPEYHKEHGRRSAKIIVNFLKSKHINLDYNKIDHLITYHELGGDEDTDLIKDADSLSFLDAMPVFYIKKYGKNRAEKKFRYMKERIVQDKSKEIAKHLYKKAIKLLNDAP